jgi:(heptosyl)LPS beta-1,4-glucosyltransferase
MIIKKLNVTAITVVYNEESRIESLLKNFEWCQQIILVDKSSTDKTVELAKKFTQNIITVPYSDAGDEFKLAVEEANNPWIFHASASGLIHPRLVLEIGKTLEAKDFPYDIIELPYQIRAFGVQGPNSPWYCPYKPSLFRKSAVSPSDKVHQEISFNSSRVYKLPWIDDESTQYHLTHQNMDSFFERHIRYTRYEAQYFKNNDQNKAVRHSFWQIIRALGNVIIKKRCFMLGWDGIALGMAYVSYFMMKFLFTWDRFHKNGNVVYPELKKEILEEWDKYSFKD